MKLFRIILAGLAMAVGAIAGHSQTTYRIENAQLGSVLDLNGYYAWLWSYYGGPYQHWLLEEVGTDTYIIRNEGTNNVLDVDGISAVQYPYYGGPYQHWKLEPVAGGGFTIRNAGSGHVLDNDSGVAKVVAYYDGPYQTWNIASTDTPPPVAAIPLYRLMGEEDCFLTTNSQERDQAVGQGYADVGAVGYVYATQVSGTVPLHRYWNPGQGAHFYTTNYATLGGGDLAWIYEGVQCYVHTTGFFDGLKPVYRYYQDNPGRHTYTATPITGSGYAYEGVAFYAK
jgi:hypothetical protein